MYFHQFRINCIFIILELFFRRYFVKYDRVFVQDYDELMYEAIGLGRGRGGELPRRLAPEDDKDVYFFCIPVISGVCICNCVLNQYDVDYRI